MASCDHTAATFWIWGLLSVLSSVSPIFAQTVMFSVRDQTNDRFIFAGETDIELICEYSGFASVPSLEITHKGTVIARGSNTLSSNYTVHADDDSVILTIKMASEYTSGSYTCFASDNDLGLTDSMSVNFEVLTLLMGPRCWSSQEGGIFSGQSFSADCFFADLRDDFEGEWVKVSPDGTETLLSSTELILSGKKKQTVTVPSVTYEDDGALYKCRVTHKFTSLIPLTPCEVGPVYVFATTTPMSTLSYPTTQLSTTVGREVKTTAVGPEVKTTAIEREVETTELTTRRPKAKVTDDLNIGSPLEDLLLYIIIGAAVVGVVLILIIVCICVCCCKSEKSEDPKPDKKDPENVSNEYTTRIKSQPSLVYDAPPTKNDQRVPDYDLPPVYHKNGDDTASLRPTANQSPDDVEYHTIALALDENSIDPFVPSQPEMVSTHL